MIWPIQKSSNSDHFLPSLHCIQDGGWVVQWCTALSGDLVNLHRSHGPSTEAGWSRSASKWKMSSNFAAKRFCGDWMGKVDVKCGIEKEERSSDRWRQQRIVARSLSNKNVNWSENSHQVSPRWLLRQLVTVRECQDICLTVSTIQERNLPRCYTL